MHSFESSSPAFIFQRATKQVASLAPALFISNSVRGSPLCDRLFYWIDYGTRFILTSRVSELPSGLNA
jgi:hypothetical protein